MTLSGPFPTKKNQLMPRRGRNGRSAGFMYDPEVGAFIKRLAMEARGAWGHRRELLHPNVQVKLFVAHKKKDRDGLWTTILDALKKGRVIWDDSIEFYNGTEIKHPATLISDPRQERVVITLEANDTL